MGGLTSCIDGVCLIYGPAMYRRGEELCDCSMRQNIPSVHLSVSVEVCPKRVLEG